MLYVLGVMYLGSGVWCYVFGEWCVLYVLGVMYLGSGVWCYVFGEWCVVLCIWGVVCGAMYLM